MALATSKNKLMLGNSRSILEVYHQIERLAPVRIAVLIHGETGTGKELAAQEIHRASPRAKGPFIALNVAAIPETLLESELFGHRKGAFTGATQDHQGFIERAQGGTLFIDEIGELPLHLQAKLLRVLQEKQVMRVGDTILRSVDFRLITATHRDLAAGVAAGDFREDLYYRIAGAVLELPPLRERGDDIVMLAGHFHHRFCLSNGLPTRPLSETAMHSLKSHSWHGNVRELENVVERAAVMADGDSIRSVDIEVCERARHEDGAGSLPIDDLEAAKHSWLKQHVQTVLRKFDGHRGKTALALGISRRTLTRYLDELKIA